MEPERAVGLTDEHTVKNHRMEVHVQIERRADALHNHDGAAAARRRYPADERDAGTSPGQPARTRRPPRDRARGPTPRRSAPETVKSAPIASPAQLETRDPPGALPVPSCAVRHSWDRSLAPCMKTPRSARDDTPHSETARSQPPSTRTSGSPETHAQQIAAGPAHRGALPPAHGTSHSARARSDAARPVRGNANDS